MSKPDAGIVVFAHGSRIESANEAVRSVCRAMAQAGGHTVEAAFLELGNPDLHGAIGRLVDAGLRRVIVIPSSLGYGAAGYPPAVGPNENLVFVVDLLAVQ